MKNRLRNFFVLSSTLVCLLLTSSVFSQQTLTQINGWNAYVHLPASYNNSSTTTYPTIIFLPGIGEIGTNPSALISQGPGAYISQGWNGNVDINGNTVEFIVISIQPPGGYPNEIAVNEKIQTIKSQYRVNTNKLYLTGLSHGGWCSTTFVTGDPLGGPYNYASQIAAVVEVQGMVPDDNSPYPGLFDNFANAGGRLLGFEQIYDNRGMPTRVNRMNATKPNSAIYVQTNFGGGGHCCWNEYYGGQGTQPGIFLLDGINQNLYQWLARQSLGNTVPPPPPTINQPPVANAGTDKIILLPTTSATLNGSGTDVDGIITAYEWTKISGPTGVIITNANNAQATITSLTQGIYSYQLKVTDNSGNSSTDLVQVTVNALINVLPTANAGTDQTTTLPTNTANLSGSGADTDGSTTYYQWSQVSGPSYATFSNTNSGFTSISNMVQGYYTFQLKVTDNAGAIATDNVVVTVNAAVALPPTSGCNSNSPVTYTLSQTGSGEIYRPNGSLWKGGDTIKITGTNYSVIEFSNVGGDPCRPLVIMPMTTVTTPIFRLTGDCRYIKIWGGKTPYGIKVANGTLAIASSHHIEVDNVECFGGNIGVYCKQNVEYGNRQTWYPNYRMTKFTFKNMWIHDIDGEGMYIGITQPDGMKVRSTYSGQDTMIIPIRLDSVEVSNCIVERTNWDAIQISNARNGNKIFNNTIRDYGRINMNSQQAGIILGGNTNGDIYGNSITKGTGNGIQIFGHGVINVYDNTLDSCGHDGVSNTNGTQGQQSVYASDYITTTEPNPKQTMNIYGNTIKNPKTAGAVYITGYANNSFPSSVYNNNFCIPNAPANWQFVYIKSFVTGSTATNNILSCGTVVVTANVPPVANAGSDIVVTLPSSSTSLPGSGTDQDGSIASYVWNLLSGPAGSNIISSNAAMATVNALVQGVYSYELTVTDNGGATAKDTIFVTVSAGMTLLPAVNPANTVTGLDYKYYEGSWNILPPFETITPIKTGTTSGFDLSVANRNDQFGFSFTGFITVPTDGVYTFYTTSDDGSNLYIDNVLTVNNDGLHPSLEKSGTIGLKAGKHAIRGVFFEQGGENIFNVSYEGGGLPKQSVPVSSLFRIATANNLPTVNAGANQSVTLPTSSTTLTGAASDSDGSIANYTWTEIAGNGGVFSNPSAAVTTVSGLTQGTYQFQLRVTDNAGAVATALTEVTVNASNITTKIIRVNVFGGTNAFTDNKWNNWNTNVGTNSSTYNYEDQSLSTVYSSITGDKRIVDNGVNYANGSTACPANVLRYNTAATSQRTLTISGLNPVKKYTLEFYASRALTGNKTVYAIGNVADTIDTDYNLNDYANFINIAANNTGTLVVELSRIGTWNYLAGFSIIEQAETVAPAARSAASDVITKGAPQISQGETLVEMGANAVSVYPNPFVGSFKVQLNNSTKGEYILSLSGISGQTVLYKKINKINNSMVETLNVSHLPAGTYVLQIIAVATGNKSVHKVIKN